MLKKIKYIVKRFLGLNTDITYKDCINMGMKVGNNVHQLNEIIIDYSHCWLIEIGNDVVFGPQAYLLAHDASTKKALGYTKIGKIKIGDGCFVGARSVIMPGVEIGKNCIIAAGSVVTKSIGEGNIIGGNPAKIIGATEDYINKHEKLIKSSNVYDEKWTIGNGITNEMKEKMRQDLDSQEIGYVI